MTRKITCTIINNLNDDLKLAESNKSHGKWSTGPLSVIYGTNSSSHEADGQEAFVCQKTTGSVYGAKGWVNYQLGSGNGYLAVDFSVPYTMTNQGDTDDSSWSYALLHDMQSDTNIYVEVTGFVPDGEGSFSDNIKPVITIQKA